MEFCIIYISSANGLPENKLRDLWEKSQKNNRDLGISGVLLYCNGSIMQVLEGDKEKVNLLYQVIAKDPRHKQVTRLYYKHIDKRSFADWSMGYKTLDENEMSTLASEIPFVENPFATPHSSDMVMSLVETFYKNNHRN